MAKSELIELIEAKWFFFNSAAQQFTLQDLVDENVNAHEILQRFWKENVFNILRKYRQIM